MSSRILIALLICLGTLPGCRAPSADTSNLPPEKNLLVLDLAQAGDRLVAVGEMGSILVSDDQGAHWKKSQTPSTALLTAVHFVDSQHGWAVGHDLLILATQDGGLSWVQQHAAPEESRPLLDVWFRNAQEGFATGAYGALLATTDGGKTWQNRQSPDDDRHLYGITALPDGTLFVAGETGTLRRSEDGGNTWQPITTPYGGSYFGLLAADDHTLLLFGLRGHVLRSEDKGQHWEEITTPATASLMSGIKRQNGNLMLVGAAGTVLESTDQGRHFSKLAIPGHLAWADIIEGKQGLILAGESGVLQP